MHQILLHNVVLPISLTW